MKQFRFGLDTVLDYKMQTLEHLKTEHAAINRKVIRQEEEVIRAHSSLSGYEDAFDRTKGSGALIEYYRLYDMCIERMGKILELSLIHISSRQQADAIANISQGVKQISSVVQMNSATSEESAAASEELSGQANVMKSLLNQFRISEDAGNKSEPYIAEKRRETREDMSKY